MHLPLKLAISLPVTIAAVGGIIYGLASPEGRRIHPVYGFPEGLLFSFFFAIAALLLVLPNLAGAVAANRLGANSPPVFLAVLATVVVGAWYVQALLLQRGLRTMGTVDVGFDWKIITVLTLDVLVLAGAALWHGRT